MNLALAMTFYAAALSTILAIIAILKNARDSKPFRIRKYAETELPSKVIEAHITNMSSFHVAIDGIWLGYTFRPWVSPFKRILKEGVGMAGYDLEKAKEVIPYATLYKPGGHIMASHMSEIPYGERDKWFDRQGFDHRLSIVIEHSLSKTSQVLLL